VAQGGAFCGRPVCLPAATFGPRMIMSRGRRASAAAATSLALLGGAGLPWRAAGAPEERPTLESDCPCEDPRGTGECYLPVCPPGYFKCCASCKEAPCFGTEKMYLSWRGLPECIECAPGDYCDGCDTFKRCPDSTQPNRAGPRISQAKSISLGDCESCPTGLEGSFDRSVCMAKYTDVCNKEVVSRCIRSCKAEDPSRGKHLTPCERMKCTMYCSKQWGEDCATAVKDYCVFSTTLVTDLEGGIEAEEGQGAIVGCDVDCNAALPRATLTASTAALVLSSALLLGGAAAAAESL